jgi:concanavalin A-like lectin/glucanase superfamily protein
VAFKALLNMNGADGSTTFTDEMGHTFTAGGNAQIDTSQFKFGGASGLFDGTGDYVTSFDSADYTLGSADFMVQFWARWINTAGLDWICGQGNNTNNASTCSFGVIKTAGQNIEGRACEGGTIFSCGNTTAIVVDTWYHIAFVRCGAIIKVAVDGIFGADATAPAVVNNSANALSIGRWGEANSNYFHGWIDDWGLSDVPYCSDFTPPTSQLTDAVVASVPLMGYGPGPARSPFYH